ncbi:MAG: TlyA family rRNA (cytidine-2'-O)-methyltransferase [Candidatus Rokuibacteriota bacterium]|nr:MAG: TlyA family rRNA (cytidine-2'-O)-methyltransferase [Candidatus Rokubacteria bacterium]PYM56038.1 MAG: TlyA family rRNA (cytidine-2'-O)-methyltransferase [Candidatus Rokubacteria bacterium]
MKKSLAKKPHPGPARPAPGRAPVGGQAKVKERIDVALVSRGLAPTREKAARLLLAGAVLVDGRRVDKPGVLVAPGAELKVTARQKFVSRGGDKLAHALVAFGVEPKGRVCVDVGASTGGFTHCLLENGAARVYAVDVGQGQLDASLRADGRVVVMEKTNARQLAPDAFPDPPTLATIDISFISLEKVLSPVFNVLTPDGEAIALVKPQFEVGKGLVGKGGVVRDASHHKAVVARVARYCVLHGWHARGVAVSPLKGPKGNREFFLHLTRTGRTAADLDQLIARAAETPEPE